LNIRADSPHHQTVFFFLLRLWFSHIPSKIFMEKIG